MAHHRLGASVNDLEVLRNEIDKIDEEIFKAIKKRTQVSLKIGELKEKLQIPLKDFAREQECFLKALELSKNLNLPISEMLEIKKNLIDISILGQEENKIRQLKQDHPKKIAIIGGAGRLGLFLSHYFHDAGQNITIIDKIKPKQDFFYIENIPNNITDFDVIIIATPIRESIKILNDLSDHEPKKTLVFDVSSLKNPLKKPLENLKSRGFLITSLHPMFGPKVKILFGRHIIRTSLNVKKADEEVHKLFENSSLSMVDLSFDEHDMLMSDLLALPHLINILFLSMLKDNRNDLSKLLEISSTTFIDQLKIAKNVSLENPHLYYEIQALNQFNDKLYKNLTNKLKDLISIIERDEEGKFIKIFEQNKGFL